MISWPLGWGHVVWDGLTHVRQSCWLAHLCFMWSSPPQWVSRAASGGALKVPKCNKRERTPVGLHFASLWVMFAVVLLANPESVWGGTTQGYECREVGTNRGYHCTIYQGVESVHIYSLVRVSTF